MIFSRIIGIAIFFFFAACQAESYIDLDPQEFSIQLSLQPEAQVLDVGTSEEYEMGHIASAINISYFDNDFSQPISELDERKAVFIYCMMGGRSEEVALKLSQAGYKEVYHLKGGLLLWKKMGYDVEK